MFDFQRNLKPIFILKLHYLQNPRLSETKQWIKQRCIFTHKNCHFQFNPKVTQCAVWVFMLASVKIRKTEKNTRANKYFLPWEITFSFSNKTNTGLISQNLLTSFLCLNQDQSRPRPLIIIIILNHLWCHHDDNSGTCHKQTPKYVNLNKKGSCPLLFGIWSNQTFPQKMLVKVVSWRVVSSQNWSLMDVAGSDINNRGITRQTHGPLSDNCHIWDQFSIQNTTVTQLSITKAPLENISNQNIFIEWIFITSVLLIRYSFYHFIISLEFLDTIEIHCTLKLTP